MLVDSSYLFYLPTIQCVRLSPKLSLQQRDVSLQYFVSIRIYQYCGP